MFILISSVIFIFDQLIKFAIHSNFSPNQSVPVVKGILYLTYVQNQGAAFGLFNGWRQLIIAVGIAVIAGICYIGRKNKADLVLQVSLALILGGSLGNLADRIIRSYVVDYIDFRFWPVFNLADMMINLGVFIVIIKMIIEKKDAS